MADTHSVSLSTGETGPDSPSQTVPEGAVVSPHGVSIPTGAVEQPDTPIDQIANEERPQWLPEKFSNAQELATAYANLEAKMGKVEAPEAPEAPEKALAGADTLQTYYDEYAQTGELTEESFGALEGMGLSRELVSSFMQGQKATHEAELNKIYQDVGGAEAYQAALGWAVQAMKPEEIQAYNDQVETGDMATAMVAVRERSLPPLAGPSTRVLSKSCKT